MRSAFGLFFLAPCVIAANQPTFTYALPAGATVSAMAVDAAGNTYLTGSTTSATLAATAGALQTQFEGGNCLVVRTAAGVPLPISCSDAFVIELNPAGKVLLATYFGGNGSQTVASAICVDASGNIYLGGSTFPNSVNQPDTFPVTTGAAYVDFKKQFAFVAKLNPAGTQLVYSTLLPVNPPALALDGRAVAMAVGSGGEVYIATTTAGAGNFPTTAGAFQAAPASYSYGSGVVAKLNSAGSALLYATYLSGDGLSSPQGIAVDAAGDAFVCGFTAAPDFPITQGAAQTDFLPSATYMEFAARLNPQGTGLTYSMFLGATTNTLSEIKVDPLDGAYVLAAGGEELSSGGYISHVNADGSALVYSTYVPTTTGFGMDLDAAGSAFVGGALGSSVLAASAGAFQSGLVGTTGNVIAAKFTSNGQFAGATYADVSPTAGARPLIAVAPNGAIMLAEQATVISIFPWLTVQNAASGEADAVASGEIVTLRGYGIGPATAALATGQAPQYQLGGTAVTIGGVAAPVFSAQSQEVVVQVPWEIAGQRSTEVVVSYGGQKVTASVPLVVAKAAPGILAVANPDGSINSSWNPARAGNAIAIYGTGGGVTEPRGSTGGFWSISGLLPTLTLPVSVSIGGLNAVVLYAGSAPTLESGYFQVNVGLPSGFPAMSSAANLVVTVGGSSSLAVPISIR